MNIRDIARLAKVTPGTVSKVLNNYPEISEATRQHVMKVIAANQYDPSANRSGRPAPANIRVGIFLESVFNPLYAYMEHIVSRHVYNAGYTIFSFHDNFYQQDKWEKYQELAAYTSANKLSALVYIGGNFSRLTGEQMDLLGCPAIFVNTVLPMPAESGRYSSVQVNHYDAAFAQMRYLLDQGHKKICTVISSDIDNSVYGLRAEAYRAALRQYGLEENLEYFLQSDYDQHKAYCTVSRHLRDHPDTTAVCSVADQIVPPILRAIHDAGKEPGKDVAVISFDGGEGAEYCIPSVTTFEQPREDMLEFISDLLFDLLNGKRKHQHVIFQAKFIKGGSC